MILKGKVPLKFIFCLCICKRNLCKDKEKIPLTASRALPTQTEWWYAREQNLWISSSACAYICINYEKTETKFSCIAKKKTFKLKRPFLYSISLYRSILSKWDVTGIKKHHSVDCSTILHALNVTSTETVPQDSNDASACITCVELTRDTVWAGTASGHILILDALTGHLVTWFHSYEETRTLTFIQDPGPTGTEQGYVISTGKGLRREGLGAKGVCILSPERVWAPPEIKRRVSESKGKTFGVRKVRSPTPPCDDPNAADEPSASVSLCKCTMIMWEAVSKECFARIEAKSGRKRYCGDSADKASCEDYNNFNRSTEI